MKDNQKKTDVAVALRYTPSEDNAPVVVAGGKGYIAGYIKELAEEHDIPLYKDEELARSLIRLGLGSEIPESLYQAVAQILIHVAQIDKKMVKEKESHKTKSPSAP